VIRTTVIACVACALLLVPLRLAAEEKESEEARKEREDAAAEEQDEATKSGLAFRPVTLKGRLTLNPVQDGETAESVVGAFATAAGVFQVKFDREAAGLRKTLLAKNGKEMTLIGKIRNQRKYFVVTGEIAGGGPVGPAVVSPGGL
jgi:hypothetical protein